MERFGNIRLLSKHLKTLCRTDTYMAQFFTEHSSVCSVFADYSTGTESGMWNKISDSFVENLGGDFNYAKKFLQTFQWSLVLYFH